MRGRYIPPGRRNQPENAAGEKPPSVDRSQDLLSLEDIREYFWPATDDLPRFSETGEGRTLHDSAATPGKLSYIILFRGANPRWDSDNIIFSKSSLHLLPEELADDRSKAPSAAKVDSKPEVVSSPVGTDSEPIEPVADADGSNESQGLRSSSGETPAKEADSTRPKPQQNPIAVFKQIRGGQQGRSFKFYNWYQIDRLAFLEPKSEELIKMLEQKWSKVDKFGNVKQEQRGEEQWKRSLSYRWAVLKLKKDEVAEKELGAPKVERIPDLNPESPKVAKKSVNEMLAELRMSDGKSEEHDPA